MGTSWHVTSGTIKERHVHVRYYRTDCGATVPLSPFWRSYRPLRRPQALPTAPVQPQVPFPSGAPHGRWLWRLWAIHWAPLRLYPPATAEQITALITPHVGDPNLKAALQQQMAAMGINALPDAQPHQYGELNHRFTQVIQKFQAGAAAAQQPIVPASII
jgi:hypothetical protein